MLIAAYQAALLGIFRRMASARRGDRAHFAGAYRIPPCLHGPAHGISAPNRRASARLLHAATYAAPPLLFDIAGGCHDCRDIADDYLLFFATLCLRACPQRLRLIERSGLMQAHAHYRRRSRQRHASIAGYEVISPATAAISSSKDALECFSPSRRVPADFRVDANAGQIYLPQRSRAYRNCQAAEIGHYFTALTSPCLHILDEAVSLYFCRRLFTPFDGISSNIYIDKQTGDNMTKKFGSEQCRRHFSKTCRRILYFLLYL